MIIKSDLLVNYCSLPVRQNQCDHSLLTRFLSVSLAVECSVYILLLPNAPILLHDPRSKKVKTPF